MKAFSDWPTFPQLYLQGELLGGLDIVSKISPFPSNDVSYCFQVKEEMENNPDFFADYKAAPKGEGGMAAPEAQAPALST